MSLDDGAVLEAVDVAGVDLLVVEVAHLGARPVARHALPVLVLLLGRARPHARARVLRGRFAFIIFECFCDRNLDILIFVKF